MEVPKIHLSSAETELMQNAGIILTKNRVLQKIKNLLEIAQEKQLGLISHYELTGTDPFLISPKISKGENYEGLPYIILDYPRMASAEHFFFIRNMFWWGNYFSSTLHLSGNYKGRFKNEIENAYPILEDHFIGIHADQWMHHFEETNYRKIGLFSPSEFAHRCKDFPHIKIAAKWPLDRWEEAPSFLTESWKFYLRLCGLIA